MTTAAIGIICKTPRSGSSKTRLIGMLGPDGAAEIAGCFLRDVAAAIDSLPKSIGRKGYAIYSPEGSEADLRQHLPADFDYLCRRDSNLGVVLHGAVEHLLASGHDSVILVNGDSPTLPPTVLSAAIEALRAPGDRLVLGPAADGGYYLIGLRTAHARLFADIAWSTPAVLATTLQRAGEIGLETRLLPVWYDVDDEETLHVLIGELEGRGLPFDSHGLTGGPASATRRFVDRLPDLARPAATRRAVRR